MSDLIDPRKITAKLHYPPLDGIRGLAILLVFFRHYGDLSSSSSWLLRFFNGVKNSGWIGVDLFFVLSGFLITGILFDSRNDSDYYRRFYIRRALRLFPLFYGLCLLILVLSPLLEVHWSWGYLAFPFYGANIAVALDPILGSIGLVTISHLWSLAVEEQFYLLWPMAVRRFKDREGLLRFTYAVIVLAFVLRIVALRLGVPAFAIYRELPTRMDSLAVGAALALLLRGPRPERWMHLARISLLPLIIALAVMGFYQSGLRELNPITMLFGYTLLAFASGALIAETLHPSSITARFFNNLGLQFLGKISYGLYVYHLLWWRAAKPLYGFLSHHLHSQVLSGIGIYAVFLTGTILFSYISYRFYEMPFLRLKDKLAPAKTRQAVLQAR